MIIINFDSDIRSHCIHVFTAWVSLEFITRIAITIISTVWQLASFHLQLTVLCCVPHLIVYTSSEGENNGIVSSKWNFYEQLYTYGTAVRSNRKMLNEKLFYSYLLIHICKSMCSMCILNPRQVTKNKCIKPLLYGKMPSHNLGVNTFHL